MRSRPRIFRGGFNNCMICIIVVAMLYLGSSHLEAAYLGLSCEDCPTCPPQNALLRMDWPKPPECKCPKCDICFPCPRCEVNISESGKAHHKAEYSDLSSFLKRYDDVDSASILNRDSAYVAPILTMPTDVKVYNFPIQSSQGRSGRRVIDQGLEDHPNIHLVDSIEEADFVVWHTCGWDKEMIPPPEPGQSNPHNMSFVPSEKLIMIDTSDHPMPDVLTGRRGRLALFKRSWPKKVDQGRRIIGFQDFKNQFLNVYPTGYAIVKDYLPFEKFNPNRDIDVICSLRRFDGPTSPRELTMAWMREYQTNRGGNKDKIRVGSITSGTREVVDNSYQQTLNRAKIIVTANPMKWEGDSRLYEALASGALVFCDPIYTPLEHPLIHDEHVVFFDTSNTDEAKKKFFEKLDYYLRNEARRKQVAWRGYVHAMRYYRAVNRMDAVLTKVLKQLEHDRLKNRNEIFHKS